MTTTRAFNIRTNGFLNNRPMTNKNEPSSPTCSVFSSFSWIADRSSSEVKHVLKTALNSLVEKERDLKLAAEVGKTLLENNTLLEQKYHTLQNEYNMQYQQSTKYYQQKLQTNEHVITNLEHQNEELLKKYEATLESKEKVSRQNISSQQKLTSQINELYQSLELAYEKIQKHEEYRQNYIKKLNVRAEEDLVKMPISMDAITINNDNSEISHKMEHMMIQNQQLLKAKENIEFQVQDAVIQLKELQAQFNQVQQSKEQFNLLENKFQHQENHIHQLTSLIDEYRSNLVSDCHKEKIPSLIAGNASHFSSDDEEEYDRFDALPQHIKGNSLFSELESAFNNNSDKKVLDHHFSRSFGEDKMMLITSDQRQLKKAPKSSKSSNRKMSCIYPGLKADDSLIAPMAVYHKRTSVARNIQKPKGLLNHIIQIPFNSMYIIWRFIRFFIVIQLAMVIHFFTRK